MRRGWRFAAAIIFVLLIWGGVLVSEMRTPQLAPPPAISATKMVTSNPEATGAATISTNATITVSDIYVLATELSPSDAMGSMPGMDASAAVSSAYMTLTNSGSSADTLISLSCDAAARTDLHQTTVTNNIAQMVTITSLTIPAGGSVTLKPGGYHAMLNNLKNALLPGQTVSLTLKFASGTVITLKAPVRAP